MTEIRHAGPAARRHAVGLLVLGEASSAATWEALARERKQRSMQALCHRLEAEVTMRVEPFDPDAAERQYREALVLAAELGMRPLVAHCHLGLGRLYRRTGDRARGDEHLTTAATMYGEMEMAFWLAQAERDTKELA
jgi:hypothetical protein